MNGSSSFMDKEMLINEKLSVDSLVFRPPAKPEVNVRQAFHRRRCLLLSLFLTLLLVTASVLLLLVFLHDRLWLHGMGRIDSTCRVLIPERHLELQERISVEPRFMSLFREASNDLEEVDVHHLLNDRLTVVHTKFSCYLHPMKPEIVSMMSASEKYTNRLRAAEGGLVMKAQMEQLPWKLSDPIPSSEFLPLFASLNCTGPFTYRLIPFAQPVFDNDPIGIPRSNSLLSGCPSGCYNASRDDGQSGGEVCRCPYPADPVVPSEIWGLPRVGGAFEGGRRRIRRNVDVRRSKSATMTCYRKAVVMEVAVPFLPTMTEDVIYSCTK